MPYKDPEKSREAARIRQQKYRERNREKLRINNLGRYHALYKKDDEAKEKARIRSIEWRLKNKNKVKKYLARNPDQREKSRIRATEWQKNNRGKTRARNALRKRRLRNAMPKWVNRSEIAQIYEKACHMETLDGKKYHVDHIIPIVNDKVCGLHVPWNLQIILASDNLKKGNQF